MKQQTDTDKKLFDRINHSDMAAFNTLFRKYYTVLCRFIMTYTHDFSSAEEIIQELFVALWEGRKKIKIATSVKTYLYIAAKNRTLNYLKTDKARYYLQDDFTIFELETKNPDDDDDNMKQFIPLLEKAIKKLPKKCSVIFQLHRFEGLTYDEIAQYLDISKKTVENQISIALKKLREELSPQIGSLHLFILLCYTKN